MACIVYQTNKKTGYMYAYHAVAYRDPVTKSPKSRRTYIGRVNPETKEFLHPREAAQRLASLDPVEDFSITTVSADNEQVLMELRAIRKELATLKNRLDSEANLIKAVQDVLKTFSDS